MVDPVTIASIVLRHVVSPSIVALPKPTLQGVPPQRLARRHESESSAFARLRNLVLRKRTQRNQFAALRHGGRKQRFSVTGQHPVQVRVRKRPYFVPAKLGERLAVQERFTVPQAIQRRGIRMSEVLANLDIGLFRERKQRGHARALLAQQRRVALASWHLTLS